MVESTSTLFLHGLAGSGGEWDALQELVPAQAPELRPAGSRDEYVEDVVNLIGSARVTLIGQSLGGHTAFLVAARRPELVERLVVIEASPERDPEAPRAIEALLTEDPAPYGVHLNSKDAARSLAEIAARDWWDEWRRIRCPVLVVRGERGQLSRAAADQMVHEVDRGLAVEVPGAGHDVHLEEPVALAAVIQRWFASLNDRG